MYSGKKRWLHIGNIAGNAYEAAKLQNNKGMDSDVISPDIFHAMCSPIWDEVEIDTIENLEDMDAIYSLYPDWVNPEFFFEGYFNVCLSNLILKNNFEPPRKLPQDQIFAIWYTKQVKRTYKTIRQIKSPSLSIRKLLQLLQLSQMFVFRSLRLYLPPVIFLIWNYLIKLFKATLRKLLQLLQLSQMLVFRSLRLFLPPVIFLIWNYLIKPFKATRRKSKLGNFTIVNNKFLVKTIFFPVTVVNTVYFILQFKWQVPKELKNEKQENKIQLPLAYSHLQGPIDTLNRIAHNYDGVVLYGPWVALGGWGFNNSYVAMEHGTIREFIFEDSEWGKACREGYRRAQKVIVTNVDCLPIALSEGYSEVIRGTHPFDESACTKFVERRKRHLESSKIKKPNLILIPSRFEIPSLKDVKGSNIAFSAIEQFLIEYPEVVIKTFAWGMNREAGMTYLKERGLSEKIQILKPVSRPILRKLFADSLCVLDGFTIPASGRIQMEAWAIGVPVLSKQSEVLNSKFFNSPTPTFESSTAEEITRNLVKLMTMSKTELADFQDASILWYEQNHSGDRFLSYLD